MFKVNKSAFFRLYRYYLKKLFLTWVIMIVLILFISALHGYVGQGLPWSLEKYPALSDLGFLWTYALIRTSPVLIISMNLISLLVQKAKNEDALILTNCSPINRQSILTAKLASFYTYYSLTSLIFTSLFAFTNPLFILFDWFLLILVIFLLFLAPIFYLLFPAQSKVKKFLIFCLYGIFLFGIFLFSLSNPENMRIFVWNPWVPMLLSILIGPLFLWLYWDNFKNHDY